MDPLNVTEDELARVQANIWVMIAKLALPDLLFNESFHPITWISYEL